MEILFNHYVVIILRLLHVIGGRSGLGVVRSPSSCYFLLFSLLSWRGRQSCKGLVHASTPTWA